MAKIDASAAEIVRRNFDHHAIANPGANAELAHLAGHVGEQLVRVIEGDAIISVRENFRHGAIEFKQLFLGHQPFSATARALPHRAVNPVSRLHEQLNAAKCKCYHRYQAFAVGMKCARFRARRAALMRRNAAETHCNGVSPPVIFLASSISVTATRISARVFRSGASNSACFSGGPYGDIMASALTSASLGALSMPSQSARRLLALRKSPSTAISALRSTSSS